MSDYFTMQVDGIPQGKGRPRFSRKTGNVYTPSKTRSYENSLKWEAKIAMKGKPWTGPVYVEVRACMPLPKTKPKSPWPTGKPDCDNFLKVSLDALNGIVWVDDAQVVAATIHKEYDNHPRLHITARRL